MSRNDRSPAPQETVMARLAKLIPPMLTMQRSSWEQGIAAQAMLECYEANAHPDSLHYLFGLVHDAIVRQGPDGRLAVVLNGDGSSDAGAVDPACIGESIYFLLGLRSLHPDILDDEEAGRMATSVKAMLKYILSNCPRAPAPRDGLPSGELLLSHRTDAAQIWSDTVYMLPPFLASAATYYANHPDPEVDPVSLLKMSLQQIILAAEVLQSSSGLWSHIYDLDKGVFIREAYWGVGNGWVCCGIVRVLRIIAKELAASLPDGVIKHAWANNAAIADLRTRCFAILQTTIEGILNLARPDNLFHDVLDDPESFVETNLSQQMAYTLLRLSHMRLSNPTQSTELGWASFDAKTARWWIIQAAQMREAAIAQTDKWGLVRRVCGSPKFDKPGTAAEGQAWAILMEVAWAEHDD